MDKMLAQLLLGPHFASEQKRGMANNKRGSLGGGKTSYSFEEVIVYLLSDEISRT